MRQELSAQHQKDLVGTARVDHELPTHNTALWFLGKKKISKIPDMQKSSTEKSASGGNRHAHSEDAYY